MHTVLHINKKPSVVQDHHDVFYEQQYLSPSVSVTRYAQALPRALRIAR